MRRVLENRLHLHLHALWCSGASLYEILAAGQWRSPAFLDYLSKASLERDLVIEAHMAESDGEEDER